MAAGTPRIVLVTRRSVYSELLARHATQGQVAAFLKQRGQKLDPLIEQHEALESALSLIGGSLSGEWRRASVERSQLDRFLFEENDLVLAIGQDGLVANLAKYLQGQPVIGINPLPQLYDGILVRHPSKAALAQIELTLQEKSTIEERTMVEARLDDGQSLLALNEIFVGHRSHQSARYRLAFAGKEERHSSSGLIIATGTGATGWARSICEERGQSPQRPAPVDPALLFLVREAFPSGVTGTELTAGVLDEGAALEVVSEMDSGGLFFGDGIEQDWVEFAWGQRLTIKRAERRLRLVI